MKNLKFILFAALVGVLYTLNSTRSWGQSASNRSLLALSKSDHTLAIVDPATLKVLTKIPVGDDPHELISSPDGKTAYVTIYGGGSFHEINVIDLVAQKPLETIDTRPLWGPHGIVFVNGKIWFSAEGSKAVGRYDPVSKKIDWSMGTGQDRTHMIYVTSDGKKVYTTNINSGTVSILTDTLIKSGPNAQPRKDWVQTVVPASKGCEGFDVSPDGKYLWTAASEDGSITIIDLQSHKQLAKMDAKAQGANRLMFTPDGKKVLITSLSSGEMIVYDSQSRRELKRVKLGKGTSGILVEPDGSRVFVACSPDHSIAVVNLKTYEVVGRLDVGHSPDGMAWAIRP